MWWPEARLRQYVSTDKGVILKFVVQLEYDMNACYEDRLEDDWRQVARFDHERGGNHDCRFENLHMDVYENGEKREVVYHPVRLSPDKALEYATEFLLQNAAPLLSDFEKWHGVEDPRWYSNTSKYRLQ